MQRQRAYVVGGLQPGASLVVIRLAVVTFPPRSTAPAVAGCRLVGRESVLFIGTRFSNLYTAME